jgi:hypothetical protein
MDTRIVEDIRHSLNDKNSDELLQIWKENNREVWSDSAFEAVGQILTERGIKLPSQNIVKEIEKEKGRFVFDKIVTPEKLREMLENEMGSDYRITVKKGRIEIVQDASSGCVIQTKDKNGKTVCSGPYGFMPSGGLRAALIIGVFALFFIIGLRMGYLVIGIGLIPLIILMLLMKAPSRELVSNVSDVMKRIVAGQ